MNSKKKTLILMSILAFIMLAFFVRFGFREISRARSSCGDYGFVSTPCSQLPTIAEAEKILNQHKNKVNQIENVNPNQISVSVQASGNCSGKGIIS